MNTRKKYKLFVISALSMSLLVVAVHSAPNNANSATTAERMLVNLNEQLAASIQMIEREYGDLKRLGKVNDQNITEIHLKNQEITPIGSSVKYGLVEKATIKWDGEKIGNITYNLVRGKATSGYVIRNTISMLPDAHPDGSGSVMLKLTVRETLVSGAVKRIEYRFTNDREMRSGFEELVIDGIPARYEIIPTYEAEGKLEIMREYLRLTHDLELYAVKVSEGHGDQLRTDIHSRLKYE